METTAGMNAMMSRMLRVAGCIVLILFSVFVAQANACTVMRLTIGDRLLIARNHDWPTGGGLVMINPRGLAKEAISPVNPTAWTSKYGSVSFAQFGRGIPFAGMNETGLTIDLLRLANAEFPPASQNKPSVNAVQWVQYQLDTAASVAEVIASLDEIDPVPFLAMIERIHYYVTDASGDVAIIEFIEGKPRIQHVGLNADGDVNDNDEMVLSRCALANSTFADSAQAEAMDRHTNGSELRYRKALAAVRGASRLDPSIEPVDYAMEMLDRLSQPNLTQWNLVYEPKVRRITFKTTMTPSLRWIDLNEISFEPSDPKDPIASTRCIDIDANHAGNLVERLQPFTSEANRKIIDQAFDAMIPTGWARMSVKQIVSDYGQTLKTPPSP